MPFTIQAIHSMHITKYTNNIGIANTFLLYFSFFLLFQIKSIQSEEKNDYNRWMIGVGVRWSMAHLFCRMDGESKNEQNELWTKQENDADSLFVLLYECEPWLQMTHAAH